MSNFLLTVRQIFQFRFWPHRCYCQCHVILGQLLRKYDVISIFQDGDRGRSILLPVSYFLMSLPSEGRNLSTNQISSTYINLWLRYNYFWFGKTNVRDIGILLPVRSRLFHRNLHVILHQPAEFRPNRSTHCGNMTSYLFFKMGPRPLNTTSGFTFVDVTAFRKSKSTNAPNFVDIPQFVAEI